MNVEPTKSKKQQSKKQTGQSLTIDPPAQDPRLGYLTPEYILWYGENHTAEEFQIMYGKVKYRVPESARGYFKQY